MGYLICEKCGGYYELQEGEHQEDFESCECGGHIKYVKNIKNLNKCLNCGTKYKDGVVFCKECGTPLTQSMNMKSNSSKTKKSSINKNNNQCPECGTKNPKSALFCQDCGVKIREKTLKEQFFGWWNKQNKNKQAIIVISVIFLGFFGTVSMISFASDLMLSSSTPMIVSISDLYGSSINKGTYVLVSGKVIESDGSNLRMQNSKGQDILVEGSGLSVYKGYTVTVTGIFMGPSSYTTVSGGSRTVPTIRNGKIYDKP